jgi:hypothetical protein
MQGAAGFLVGIVFVAVSLAGLGYGLHEMMTQVAPDHVKSIGGLAAFVAGIFALIAIIR